MKGIGCVEMEKYEVQLDLATEQKEHFAADPHALIKNFLEQQGHEVNHILLTEKIIAGIRGGSITMMGSYHIVYPPREKSGWICA
jgi:hypothetical protein